MLRTRPWWMNRMSAIILTTYFEVDAKTAQRILDQVDQDFEWACEILERRGHW